MSDDSRKPLLPRTTEILDVPSLEPPGDPFDTGSAASFEPSYVPSKHQLTSDLRYIAAGEVGAGGMGSVHRVFDQVMQRQVAMKVLHQRAGDENSDIGATRDQLVGLFLSEARVTGQLDHPNIVPVHSLGQTSGGDVFFTMKLVRGHTLRQHLRERGNTSLVSHEIEDILHLFLRVCDAVDFAHSRNIIHRDLKPDNIMVGSHGQVYVMDWGIALIEGSSPVDASNGAGAGADSFPMPLGTYISRHSGSVVGTPGYMAPEQANGEIDAIDARTDLFALGGILYYVLTEQAPFAAATVEQQLELARAGEPRPPAQVVPQQRLPPGLCRIAMKAMARSPEARYQSISELKKDIQAFLRGGGWFDTLHVKAGELIVREGEETFEAYIIKEGQCEVYRERNNARTTLRHLGPGDLFGETAVFTSKPRNANVEAIDDVTLMVITRETLEREVEARGWIGIFLKTLAERFREVDSQLADARADRPR
ncbi:MAG: serine/threonine-protein kinase [Proteobacteria bacterium]|nr:serine/threonine-protein kinase [Pseudomonadota bacterium]